MTKGKSMTPAEIRALIKRILCVGLLAAALIVTWVTSGYISENVLDSDASSNLILGEKLAREGGIISDSFMYSTELQVIDTQIIYSLLFRMIPDWSAVRLIATILMQLMMLGAYGYLAKKVGMSFNMWCLTGAVMMLPFSVPYGRIVLYHSYYAVVLILDLWILGLYLSVKEKTEALWRGEGSWKKTLLPGALLLVVSFLAGLSGLRQMMICAAPLAVTALLNALYTKKEKGEAFWPGVLCAVAAAGMLTLGYLINSRVLSGGYTFESYDDQSLVLLNLVNEERSVENVIRGLLRTMGFQNQVPLFSPRGLVAVGGVAALGLSALLALHTLVHTENGKARFLQIFFLVNVTVMTLVFCFLGGQNFQYEMYYLLVVFWMIPALGMATLGGEAPSTEPTKREKLLGLDAPKVDAHTLTACVVCAVLLAGSCYYTGFFRHPAEMQKEVDYTGLAWTDPTTVTSMKPVAEYLKANEYDLVYAEYWDGAVLTELTDGRTKSCPIEAGARRKVIKYSLWMSDMKVTDPAWTEGKKVCVLASYDLQTALAEDEGLMAGLTEKESFGAYTILELNDPRLVADYLD